MLGEPVPVVAQAVGGLGQRERLVNGGGGAAAATDGGLVEDAEAEHWARAYAIKES